MEATLMLKGLEDPAYTGWDEPLASL